MKEYGEVREFLPCLGSLIGRAGCLVPRGGFVGFALDCRLSSLIGRAGCLVPRGGFVALAFDCWRASLIGRLISRAGCQVRT
jgi:hypothetical protein